MDRLVAEADGLAEILMRAADDTAGLTAGERARFLAYERIFYNSWELAREAWKSRLMDDGQFKAWEGWFGRETARRPHAGRSENKFNHNEEFITYVEGRVRWNR